MFDSYGSALKEFEARLNNAVQFMSGGKLEGVWEFNYLNKPPATWAKPEGTTISEVLNEEEIKALGKTWLPVHAMGYNWLKSNGESAKYVAQRIKDLKARYEKFGFTCPGVIVVTHSMGGLVARGLMHPDYGGLTESEVLGVVHSVMPTQGAAATYKRMRAGFEGGMFSISKKVLGPTGAHVTAVLANAQGPLEMLPGSAYGPKWLVVKDQDGHTVLELPRDMPDNASTNTSPMALGDIYTQENKQWWRLINPEWINFAKKYLTEEEAQNACKKRMMRALEFQSAIEKTFHKNTYAHYADDRSQLSFGRVVWKVTSGDGRLINAGSPLQWTLVSEDGEGQITVRTPNQQTLVLQLQEPAESGDGTVPADKSASQVKGKTFTQRGYEHQDSYKDHDVQAATIYSVAKMASQAVRKAYERKSS